MTLLMNARVLHFTHGRVSLSFKSLFVYMLVNIYECRFILCIDIATCIFITKIVHILVDFIKKLLYRGY